MAGLLPKNDGVVDATRPPSIVVAFHAPAPGVAFCRLAEDGEVVLVGIADVAPLDLVQDLIQVHDTERLGHSRRAQPGRHEGVGHLALAARHDLQGNPFAIARDVVEVVPLLVVEVDARHGSIFGRERREELLSSFHHFPAHVVAAGYIAAHIARWRRNVFWDVSGGEMVRRHIMERKLVPSEISHFKLIYGSAHVVDTQKLLN